jgi:hypothetical protein
MDPPLTVRLLSRVKQPEAGAGVPAVEMSCRVNSADPREGVVADVAGTAEAGVVALTDLR